MSRVTLESIPALTFYKDSVTLARRTSPIPQLVCLGKPCSLYTPDVVRCENIGGSGAEVDWRCEADLPSSLRFGKVQVSCEGWTGPGDPYVLKGQFSKHPSPKLLFFELRTPLYSIAFLHPALPSLLQVHAP
ncbi:hypothetical protein SERLA73DRAFT_107917 [Serpula lacrymans var. lacrymans S7.3]|uniref:Store-operated calcium entry-associated regulatory factor n=1 Tax=Serpula lacrymans var. lacrymans (strain S7.3) TaxID=936435 RepID=F8PY25_SERL3|nr:hypothetical protein SERLA73DRAFT_107917 [Serpula lacrymans var. lacrymans S7.3]